MELKNTNNRKHIKIQAVTLLLASIFPNILFPNHIHNGSKAYTLSIENDIFSGQDGGYTNGFCFSWTNGFFDTFNIDNSPHWLHSLTKDSYINTSPNKHRAISYTIFQTIQTANDITIEGLVDDEPPYAGALAWASTLHAFDQKVSDRLTLVMGIVGPASGAEKVQKWVHNIIGSTSPKGWSHQISNEPILNVQATRSWRLQKPLFSNGTEIDFITSILGNAGNFRTDVGAAFSIRVGENLLKSFPSATTLPGRGVNPLAGTTTKGWNIFFNILVRYVASDITIDGNTFEDSHSVKLKHEQSILVYGGTINIDKWSFLLSIAKPSDSYRGQRSMDKFGSLSISYHY